MKHFRIIFILLASVATANAYAQPTVLGTDAISGAYQTYNLNDYGIFRQYRIQATAAAGAGVRKYEFCSGTAGAPDYTTNWRPYSGVCNGNPDLTIPGINQSITPDLIYPSSYASSPYNTLTGGCSGFLTAITANWYYTFNISEDHFNAPPSNEFMSVLATNYSPVAITSVTQLPAAGAVYPENSVYVTVTTSAALSAGEYVYVRYASGYDFNASSLLPVTMTGTTGTVEIPCAAVGDSVYYYAYSSNRTSATILAEVTALGVEGEVAHDMSTLSIDNNGGPNYSYKVLPSIGFCGNYYVPSVCYPTIASFVTAINAGTVGCSVICNVAAGHTETAPVGGINLTQTGTAGNTITFIKNGAGANPIIYAQVGTVTLTFASVVADGIFSLNGSDYITIDGIDLIDNYASAPGTMEFGYALFKASVANGAQHNTIKNCSITLKASNISTGPSQFEDGSKGIFSGNITRTALTTTLTIATAGGRNDNNTFISNTIKNVHHGIVMRGYYDIALPYSYIDQNNVIGQVGAGNIIENYGSTSANSVYGIYVIYQNNHSISYNSINNTASGGTASTSTLYGILNGSNSNTAISVLTISNNTVALTQGGSASAMYGIKVGSNSGNTGGTMTISGNTVQNCSFSVSSSATFRGIEHVLTSTSTTISNNIIQNNTLNSTVLAGANDLMCISNSTATPNNSITDNQLLSNSKTGSSTGNFYGYYNAGAPASGTETITGNTISNLSVLVGAGASAVGIRITTGTSQAKTISNNTISNVSGGTGATVFSAGIIADGLPNNTSEVSNNDVSNISSASTTVGIHCAANNAIGTSSNLGMKVYDNDISNISSSGSSGTAIGLVAHSSGGASQVNCYNNTIDNVFCSGTVAPIVRGISFSGGSATNQVYQCKISNIKHTAGSGTAVVSGIYLTSTFATSIYKNDIHEISGASVVTASGIYVSSGTTVVYSIYNNFIQRIYGSSSTNNISATGISLMVPIATYNVSYNTIALGQNVALSGASGFGCAGVYYPNSSATLNLRNNIIYVNATPSGTGVASCVRRAGGTAFSLAANFSSSSDNNYYYINTGTWNYIYVEGNSNTGGSLINGWAWCCATTSGTYNLNNDCFNEVGVSPTSYKAFMSPREIDSYYDVPPFAGGAVLPDNLKLTTAAVTYAESGAVVIAGITTDYEGDARSGSLPDIGADEGPFEVQTGSCDLLPIELISFTGWYNGIENELHWITETEINSNYFNVQKSLNGFDFYSIGDVTAAGNSTTEINYLFYDDDPVPGINYYRLKMVDLDETFEYSNTIAIRVDADGIPTFVVYPNPASEYLSFSIASLMDETATVEIYDVPGRSVFSQPFELHEGQNSFTIDISKLARATYFIYFFNGAGEKQVLKFVKD